MSKVSNKFQLMFFDALPNKHALSTQHMSKQCTASVHNIVGHAFIKLDFLKYFYNVKDYCLLE